MIDPSIYKIYYLSGSGTCAKFYEINGVENLNIDQNLNFNNPYVLGGIESAYQINMPDEVTLSFDRSFVQVDPLFQFTGLDPINQIFIYNGNQYFKMQCLYMQQYSAAFSVGDLPKINSKFISYGYDVAQTNSLQEGLSPNIQVAKYCTETLIPKIDSISITGDSTSMNYLKTTNNGQAVHNIYSFEYNLGIQRTPYYSVGSFYPKNVSTNTPYQVSLTINSKATSNYRNDKMPYIVSDIDSYLNFCLMICNVSYLIQKARMVSSSAQISSQNTLEIKRNFIGYYGF